MVSFYILLTGKENVNQWHTIYIAGGVNYYITMDKKWYYKLILSYCSQPSNSISAHSQEKLLYIISTCTVVLPYPWLFSHSFSDPCSTTVQISKNKQFICFKLHTILRSVMKSLAIPLHPPLNMNHLFVHHIHLTNFICIMLKINSISMSSLYVKENRTNEGESEWKVKKFT